MAVYQENISFTGMFADLPNLKILRLDHNHLSNMSVVNMFEGMTTINLSHLDLSFNDIEVLPSYDAFTHLGSQVTYLNLRGNSLNLSITPDGSNSRGISAFLNLQTLDLSLNNLTSFYGADLANSTKLQVLNISCNQMKYLQKETFAGLPTGLRDIDISYCMRPPHPAPMVDHDAFSTLPPVTILRLRTSCYKKWIFTALRFSKETAESLEELYVDDNDITYLTPDSIPHLPNLKVLSLSR